MFEYKGGSARRSGTAGLAGSSRARRGEASRPARPPEVEDVAMNTITQVRQDRVRCRVAPSALALLESARQGLVSAEAEISAGPRHFRAHPAPVPPRAPSRWAPCAP